MTRTLRVLFSLTVAALSAAGCERGNTYAEPPASAYSAERFTLATDVVDTVLGAMVSPEFFTTTTMRPFLGRLFVESEYAEVRQPVAIISDRLWRRRFSAAPQFIGQTVQMNGRAVTIVGVVPPEFDWPPGADVWVPRMPR